MKKILAFILAVAVVLSLCGCMSAAKVQKVQTVTDPTSTEGISYKDYNDTLEGLCAYFADLGYAYNFTEATKDQAADPVVMAADMIGADKGYKFTYTYSGDTVVLELYSYTDTDSDLYKQAKAEGKITITEDLAEGTVDVTLSDNGKYLMVYSDEGENEERENAIVDAFKGFWA